METKRFFDSMARTYDDTLTEIGWDPLALLTTWPISARVGGTVVDFGCGTGAVLEHFRGANRDLVGFDVSDEMVARARARKALRDARLEVASAGNPWPLPDACADLVIALAMLEFVKDLDLALDEVARVLKPGGTAIVSVEDVADWELRPRPQHEHRYGEVDIFRRTREELELNVPPSLNIVRMERRPGYWVDEGDYVCAYWVAELARPLE